MSKKKVNSSPEKPYFFLYSPGSAFDSRHKNSDYTPVIPAELAKSGVYIEVYLGDRAAMRIDVDLRQQKKKRVKKSGLEKKV